PAEEADRAERERALAEVGAAGGGLELVVPLRPQCREILRRTALCELVGLSSCLGERHAGTAAAARTAAAERSTSSRVVRQFETEMRIACSPCQSVPPSQQVPSSCTRRITSAVRSPSSKRTSTWLSTTSLRIVAPPSSSSLAKSRACSQLRSTISATPLRPRERSAAYTAKPRARRENSGVQSISSRSRRSLACTRYEALTPIAARWASGCAQKATPE